MESAGACIGLADRWLGGDTWVEDIVPKLAEVWLVECIGNKHIHCGCEVLVNLKLI